MITGLSDVYTLIKMDLNPLWPIDEQFISRDYLLASNVVFTQSSLSVTKCAGEFKVIMIRDEPASLLIRVNVKILF